MQIARWGNSLAVRIPAPLAAELGVSEGTELLLRAHSTEVCGLAEEQAGYAASATVGKWGNSLGLRLPKAVVEELEVDEGSHVAISVGVCGIIQIFKTLDPSRKRSRAEALASFRQSRGIFSGSVRFPRDDLQLRGPDVDD